MRARQLETTDLDAVDIVVVTFTRPRNLAGYRRRFADPLTVLADPDRELYRLLDLGRGSIARVWGWRAARKYVSLLLSGKRLNRGQATGDEPHGTKASNVIEPHGTKATHVVDRTNEDTLQLGGNALIAADGTLAWVFRGAGPDDRPSIDEIVAAVDAL